MQGDRKGSPLLYTEEAAEDAVYSRRGACSHRRSLKHCRHPERSEGMTAGGATERRSLKHLNTGPSWLQLTSLGASPAPTLHGAYSHSLYSRGDPCGRPERRRWPCE